MKYDPFARGTSICFRIGFCGVAVTLVFLCLFLSSYYNSEVNIIMKKIIALLLALFMLVGGADD